MLTAENISVKRGRNTVLRQAYLSLRPGVLTVVVGPNGSGKSTLIKAVTGELPLARGGVRILGKTLDEHLRHPREIAQWRAVLPQQSNLFFNFSVLDVVMMGRTPHLVRGETARDYDICEQALERVGATAFRDRSFQQLSGGEKQRIQLARVIAQLHDAVEQGRPGLLFLDEPTANLDLKHQYQILDTAREFAVAGLAVCVILHDLEQARQIADEVMVLNHGAVRGYGPAADVLSASRIRHVFEVEAQWVEHQGELLLHTRSLSTNPANPKPTQP
ncbi:MAG: heme ABC transporter ATP-binding protein [Opitutales bacterium]